MALSLDIEIGGSLWSALGFDAAFSSLDFEFQAIGWESGVKAQGAPKLRAPYDAPKKQKAALLREFGMS